MVGLHFRALCCYDLAVHSFHATRNNIRRQRDSEVDTTSTMGKSAMAKSGVAVLPFVIYAVAFLVRIHYILLNAISEPRLD